MSRLKKLLAVAKSRVEKKRVTFYLPVETDRRFRSICDTQGLEYSHVVEALLDDFCDNPPLIEGPPPATRSIAQDAAIEAQARESPIKPPTTPGTLPRGPRRKR